MILSIPGVLTASQVTEARQQLEKAQWVDGKTTAGYQSAKSKNNFQLPHDHPIGEKLGSLIENALREHPLFMSAAIPLHILPPMFNSYTGGQAFGTHVDNAIRMIHKNKRQIRTDLSCTLFLSEPEEYDGGELSVEDTFGVQRVKLPAGHMVLYPATSLHHVTPVTRGRRVSSFFWVQSMIREDSQRSILFDLDLSIQRLARDLPDNPVAEQSGIQLTGVYHNLLRQWAEM